MVRSSKYLVANQGIACTQSYNISINLYSFTTVCTYSFGYMAYNSSICFSTDCMRIVVVVCALDCRDGIGRHFTPFDKQVFIPSNHQIQDFSLYLYHKVKLTQLFFCIGEYIRTFSICIDAKNESSFRRSYVYLEN